jgi:hypothetical protein
VEALGLQGAELDLLRPWVWAASLRPCTPAITTGELVLYLDQERRRLVEENAGGAYDRVRAHLDRYRDRITSVAGPYGIHRPRQERFFTRPGRLLAPRKTPHPVVAPVDQPLYGDESINFIDAPPEVSRPGLLGVLSSTITWWFGYQLKRQGRQLQLDAEVLLRLPLPLALRDEEPDRAPALRELEGFVHSLCQEGCSTQALPAATQARLDRLVVALYGLPSAAAATLHRWRVRGRSG